MTRTGKIARLPREIRAQLNRRLQDGEPGTRLVEWLNSLPEVQAVLKADFDGRAISEQNLSEWKLGGYRDWLRQEEAREQVRQLAERAADLEDAAGGSKLSDRLATVLAAELASIAEKAVAEITDPKERWQRLREVLCELAVLRQEDRKAARLLMDREHWERQQEREEEAEIQEMQDKSRSKLIGIVVAKWNEPNMAKAYGGGEQGRWMADLMTRLRFDLPLEDFANPGETEKPSDGTPTTDMNESGGIQPDRSKSK